MDSSYISIIQEITKLIGESGDALGSVSAIAAALSSIASLGFIGFLFVVGIIIALVSLVVSIIIWVVEAIPIYSLAKKMGRKYALLAWVPFFGSYFRLWVISDIAANKPFTVYKEKYTIKNRNNSFLIYLAISVFGTAIMSSIVATATAIIPVIGSFSAVLMLVPKLTCATFEYVYLRDLLNIFKEDENSNQKTAFIVTLLDSFLTIGFARIVYLFTIMKAEPIYKKDEVVIEAAE